MRFDLYINMENAAFGDSDAERAAELAHILRALARKLDGEGIGRPGAGGDIIVSDSNGNKVGRATFENEA
jgi:hypothetical protein